MTTPKMRETPRTDAMLDGLKRELDVRDVVDNRETVRKFTEQLERKNQKLKEALQFYADPSNYERVVDTLGFYDSSEWKYDPSVIDGDQGNCARAALGEG